MICNLLHNLRCKQRCTMYIIAMGPQVKRNGGASDIFINIVGTTLKTIAFNKKLIERCPRSNIRDNCPVLRLKWYCKSKFCITCRKVCTPNVRIASCATYAKIAFRYSENPTDAALDIPYPNNNVNGNTATVSGGNVVTVVARSVVVSINDDVTVSVTSIVAFDITC